MRFLTLCKRLYNRMKIIQPNLVFSKMDVGLAHSVNQSVKIPYSLSFVTCIHRGDNSWEGKYLEQQVNIVAAVSRDADVVHI